MLLLTGHRGRVRSLAFSADGLLASCAGHGRAVSLWDLNRNGKRSFLAGHRERVTAVAFAPAGALLASMDYWGQVKVWDAARRRESADLVQPYQGGFGMAFTADGRRLVVGQNYSNEDGQLWYEVRHLDVATGKEVPELRARSWTLQRFAAGLAYSPAGPALAVGSGGQVHLWDLSPVGWRGNVSYTRALNALAFSPDGRTLAVAAGLAVQLWDATDCTKRATLRGHARVVTGAAFTPDGRLLASAGTDGQVKLWDLAAVRERAAFDWQVGPVTALALAPDGMRGACGGAKGDIAVWDLDP